MENNKILLVIDQIKTGGAEKILLDYKDFLINKGYNVVIFSLYQSVVKDNCIIGLKSNSNFIIIKFIQQILLWLKLCILVMKYKPMCIFSFLERSNVLVQSLFLYRGKKILTVHNLLSIQYEKLHSKIIKTLIRNIISYFYNLKRTKIIAVSGQVKEDLVKKFNVNPIRIVVINNGVDKSRIIKMSEFDIHEFDFNRNEKILINIGRFTLQKAQYKLVKLIRLLVNDGVNVHLLIIGEGEEKKNLQYLIDNYRLNEHITLIPYTDNPYKFMKHSSLFVLPSLYEGFPIVLSEAAALGLPVVGSEKAIPKEIFSDEKEEMQPLEEIDTKTIDVTEKELKQLKESIVRLDKLAEKYRIDPENQKTKEKTKKSIITTVSKKENLKSVNEKQDEKEIDRDGR